MTPAQLVKARKDMALSQTRLAKMLDLSVRHISGMETGERNITRLVELAVKALQDKPPAPRQPHAGLV